MPALTPSWAARTVLFRHPAAVAYDGDADQGWG
jgi:hypothetical protein